MMWQALVLTFIILASASITRINLQNSAVPEKRGGTWEPVVSLKTERAPFSYEKASVLGSVTAPRGPSRRWEVLDPKIGAESVLVQSLDDQFPFFHFNTYKTWPLASLTKLLTAVVVLEDIGADKKIPIDAAAVATEGEAGNLKSGEVYTALDLLKIMLLTSSNDASAAFENYLGKEEFVRRLNKKAAAIGMTQTIFHDASGLSDLNVGTASDMLRLARYILEREPEIFNWTRLSNFLVQPINDVRVQTISNINNLSARSDFLGGKTGTSEEAGENLLSLFSFKDYRLVAIILGSPDRLRETDSLLRWVNQAYDF